MTGTQWENCYMKHKDKCIENMFLIHDRGQDQNNSNNIVHIDLDFGIAVQKYKINYKIHWGGHTQCRQQPNNSECMDKDIVDKQNFDQGTKSNYIVECTYKCTSPHSLQCMTGIQYQISMLDKEEYMQHRYYSILGGSMFGGDIPKNSDLQIRMSH